MHRFLARRSRVASGASIQALAGHPPSGACCIGHRGRRPRSAAAAAAPSAAATDAPTTPKQHNFDADAERAAAIDAAREAFRSTREAAVEKNAALAAKLEGKLILAPLTRGGNLPFRQLCADFGADAAVSEMVFARSLVGRGGGGKGASLAERTRLRRAPGEHGRVFGVQIACKEIREGGAALRLAAESGADYASLNCGCPIHEATRRGLGASLLKKPTKLARLVAGLVAESDLPVEVKIRTGPGESNVNAPFVTALLEAAGAAAVTIHGRTMEQR
jgi:tRNA-dihydrouridine synthase 3